MNGLIVAGGDVGDKFVCQLIKNGAFEVIFAADSGVDVLYRNHITPDIIVGDFDSANPEALSYYRDMDQVAVTELNPEKDDTDTEHALRDSIRLGCDNVVIVGCFGSRIDHVLSNVSLLGIGLEYGVEIKLMDENNRVRMLCEGMTLKKKEQYGDYISLIPYAGMVHGLTIKGMKYNLEDATLDYFSSLGVSNEIVDEVAEISFMDGTLLLLETKDK